MSRRETVLEALMRNFRRFGALIPVCAAFLIAIPCACLMSGCGGPSGTPRQAAGAGGGDAAGGAPAETGGEPVYGDWLITRMPAETENLNPYTSSDAYASRINEFIFESLLDRDNETLEMIPRLAETWEISEDKLMYTFTLHEGTVFSDGTPLTTEDVKFSFETIKDPKVDAPHLRNYYQDVTACEIVDARTVRFVCSKPYFRHIVMLGGLEIIPKHIYGTGDFNTHPNNRKPIGSGPYILEKWDPGQQMVLAENPVYWGKRPWLAKRVYRIILSDGPALQALTAGQLDTMGLTPEQWVRQTGSRRFTEQFNKYSFYAPYYNYVGWNSRRPQFSDKRVRRALTMLLNREDIRDKIFHGLAIIVTGNAFVDSPEYNKNIQPWPYDPEQAKKLLSEAGWVDTDGDGVRDKDGTAFRFELIIKNDSPEAEQIGTIFQNELKRAGIEMSLRPLEWATFLQQVDARKYDACILAWSMPPDFDPYQVWHSSMAEGTGSNFVGFNNAEADQIMETARQTFDRDERITLYHRFHEILHEEQPYTFLFCSKSLLAVDKRFHGIVMYPFGPDSREWWVPRELQRYP
ncbi:MAG: peptide-binding protein [FCB group bacterium]|jgi:peptide/nickel transport system substrate-binding protein|nr:peptide-binding protein [FCB group bacterium]